MTTKKFRKDMNWLAKQASREQVEAVYALAMATLRHGDTSWYALERFFDEAHYSVLGEYPDPCPEVEYGEDY